MRLISQRRNAAGILSVERLLGLRCLRGSRNGLIVIVAIVAVVGGYVIGIRCRRRLGNPTSRARRRRRTKPKDSHHPNTASNRDASRYASDRNG